METYYNHIHNFCMKYHLQVNNYKRGNGAELYEQQKIVTRQGFHSMTLCSWVKHTSS